MTSDYKQLIDRITTMKKHSEIIDILSIITHLLYETDTKTGATYTRTIKYKELKLDINFSKDNLIDKG